LSGIQVTDQQSALVKLLDSRYAVPKPNRGLAARMSENTRE
jgi:hypothetical protein